MEKMHAIAVRTQGLCLGLCNTLNINLHEQLLRKYFVVASFGDDIRLVMV